MRYKQYLQSDDWKQKRDKKRRKLDHCAICASADHLDVHHLNYKDLYSVEQSDLRVLCRRCHYLAHELQKQGKIVFKSTNHHSRFNLIKTSVKKHLGLTGMNLFKNGKGHQPPRPLANYRGANNAGHDRPTDEHPALF